jgi:hypothetical protein
MSKINFAYGTIAEAKSDLTPGEIAFGYDESLNVGAIYREGKISTGRCLDILIGEVNAGSGLQDITIKYLDDEGNVNDKVFSAASADLIKLLSNQKGTIYSGSEYIQIDIDDTDPADELKKKISIKYDELYAKIKDSLSADGIIDEQELNRNQSSRIFDIENSYVKDMSKTATESENFESVNVSTSKRDSSLDSESIISTFSFNVATEKYYKQIDSSLNAIDSSIADLKKTIDSVTWIDAAELAASLK